MSWLVEVISRSEDTLLSHKGHQWLATLVHLLKVRKSPPHERSVSSSCAGWFHRLCRLVSRVVRTSFIRLCRLVSQVVQ